MRQYLYILILSVAFFVAAAPSVQAQRHRGANGGSSRTEQTHQRVQSRSNSGQSGRQGIGSSSRKDRRQDAGTSGNNNRRPNVNAGNYNANRQSSGTSGRPGISGTNGNRRPSGSYNHDFGGNNRPGMGNHRPDAGNRPGMGHRPDRFHESRPPVMRPTNRPYRPVMSRPVSRPIPPPAWRPRRGLPVVHGVLGLTFGVAFNASLDYLYSSGYSIDGYGNDIVYLRNVPALNFVWTDAALYYGTGGLNASSFYYSTPVYDMSRYNSVYTSLVGTYGMPVSVANTGGIVSSTWFGGNNGYITLSYGAGSGAGRFLTTLTLGL